MTFIFVGKTKTIILDCFNDIFDLPAILETAAAVTATVCAGLFMSRHMAIMARGRESDISSMPVKCQNETRTDVKPVVSDVTGKNKDTSGDEVFAFVPDWESPFVKSLLAYIDGRISEPTLTVAELAVEAGVSRQQLFRKTKRLVGMSPHMLIRMRRLEYARNLMIDGGYSISEVCYMSGFSSPSYFSRCFRRQFGCLPSDMRGKA